MKSNETQDRITDDFDTEVAGEVGPFRKSDGTMIDGDPIPAEGWPNEANPTTIQRLLGYMPDEL